MFENFCVAVFMFIVVWAAASAFYKGYKSKDHDREMLKRTGIVPDDNEDDGLLNSDGRPDM